MSRLLQRSSLVGCLLAATAAVAACGTGATGACPGSEASTGTMTATIDGSAFEACITTGSNSDGVVAIIGQAYDDIVPHPGAAHPAHHRARDLRAWRPRW
jgi:hypothetical protein